MFDVPPEDEPQEKIADGKTCYFCRKEHNNGKSMWVRHKPEDHQSSKFQARKGNSKKGSDTAQPSKLKMCAESLSAHLSLLQGLKD